MTDFSQRTRQALLRLRKERVHTTMLVEVLALLIFMSMAFAFVLRDDALRTNTWKQKYDALAVRYHALQQKNAELMIQNRQLEMANKQLLRSIDGPIAANDRLIITRSQWKELISRLANAEAVVRRQQVENAALRERLSGRGGSDLPNCTVSPTNYIVRIDLEGSGYRVSPKWPASANPLTAEVNGLAALASGRTLSTAEFHRLASAVKAWGRSQDTPCNFRAEVYVHHQNMGLYRVQQSTINDAFYANYH